MATPTPLTNTPSKQLPIFSSPAPRSVPATGNANMLSYDSPAVLNMLNDATPGLGGVGMGISMSGLGMSSLGFSASAIGRADEAERTRRLRSILDVVGEKPGRVSEDGLLALCKKLDVPTEKNPEEEGSWMLLLGEEAICDVTLKRDEIAKVNLQTGLDERQPELHFGATGSQILVRSLQPLPGQSKINVTLERFAENLEKLLSLDKLGAPQNGGINCYNAIAGIYTSLKRLYEHEKKIAEALFDANTPYRSLRAEREVLCKKSGRPRMNGGSCLGLSLDYWIDRRHVLPKSSTTFNISKKGKERKDATPDSPDDDPETNKTYSLTIECESSPSALFPPLRISTDWISPVIEKPLDSTTATLDNLLLPTTTIDWLDPKPSYLDPPVPSAPDDIEDSTAMQLDATSGRLPNVRFVAKLHPPLVVPLSVYMQLFQSVGLEPRPEDFRATTFVGLALRPGEVDPGLTGGAGEGTHEVRSIRSVVVPSAGADVGASAGVLGEEEEVMHAMTLYTAKVEYARTLHALPFAHPRQLIEMLPVLRQYAFTTSLLQNSFYEKPQKGGGAPMSPPMTPGKDGKAGMSIDVNLVYAAPAPRVTVHVPHPLSSLSTFASPTRKSPDQDQDQDQDQDKINADISSLLSSLLAPKDSLDTNTGTKTEEASRSRAPLRITLDITPNADLLVAETNITSVPPLHTSTAASALTNDNDAKPPTQLETEADATAEGGGNLDVSVVAESTRKIKRLAHALDVAGDLGVWGEWVRREVGRDAGGH